MTTGNRRNNMFKPITPTTDLGAILKNNQNNGEIAPKSEDIIETDQSKVSVNEVGETPQKPIQSEGKEPIPPVAENVQVKSKEPSKKDNKKKGVEKVEPALKKHILASTRTNYYIKMRKAQLGLANAEDVLIMAFEELDKKLDKKYGPIIYLSE